MGRASIRKLVFASTLVSMLLFALLAGIVFVSNGALRGLFDEFRTATAQTVAVREELQRIQAAQMAAARHRTARAPEQAAAVIDNIDAVIACSAACGFFALGTPERAEVEAILADAQAYKTAFEALLEQEAEVHALGLDLSLTGTRARALLSDVMRGAEKDQALALTVSAGFALEAFLLGQTYAERFLLSHEALDLRSAEAEFAALKLRLEEVRGRLDAEGRALLLDAASRQVRLYTADLARASEALAALDRTQRERLDVIGPRLVARSEALHRQAFEILMVSGPMGLSMIERQNTLTIALALGAVLVGSALSLLLANRIAAAVAAMARQMRRIADGDLSFEISGVGRADELGEMARALDVFQRNARLAQDVDHLREQQHRLQSYANALKEAKTEAESAALTDPLTGLANRRHLDQRLKSVVAAARSEDRLSALHVDLDRFKQINDTLGHAAGDFVLKHTAETLRAITRPDDFIARVGGDEFVVLCKPGSPESVIQDVAARIVAELAKPVEFGGQTCRFGASVGAASAVAAEASDLIEHADIALYEAKAAGRGAVAKFTPALRTRLVESKTLGDEILAALERGAFTPHFQPQFDAVTHDLVGVEALARWPHPRRGLLTPDQFLGVAAEMRLVDRIDAQIMAGAVAFCHRAEAAGLVIPRMSVNVSLNRLLGNAVLEAAPRPGELAAAFSFELVETVFLEHEEMTVLERIDALRERGVEFEIDDFGSGHASVVSLLRLGPDRVKIDRALIAPIARSEKERRSAESIIDMVRGLSISVIAEGVETEAQAMALRDMGCETLQGFHFARPMEGGALIGFLKAEGWRGGLAHSA